MTHEPHDVALISRTHALGLTHRWNELCAALDADDWRGSLTATRALRDALNDAERAAVATARSAGATWETIGEATHTSRQAAHRKWGRG